VPLGGGGWFFLVGESRLSSRRHRRLRFAAEAIESSAADKEDTIACARPASL
jgi:hypothetical protein